MTKEEIKASIEKLRARRASIRTFDPSAVMTQTPRSGGGRGPRIAAPALMFAPESDEEASTEAPKEDSSSG